jgi:hypothetical protein
MLEYKDKRGVCMDLEKIKEIEDMIFELGLEDKEKEELSIGSFDGKNKDQEIIFSVNSI